MGNCPLRAPEDARIAQGRLHALEAADRGSGLRQGPGLAVGEPNQSGSSYLRR